MGTLRALVVVCIPALAGCPTVDLGNTPAGIGVCNPTEGLSYFQQQIWPNYLTVSVGGKSCVQSLCHDKVDSSGGFGLDTSLPIDYATNYAIVQPQLLCGNPTASPLLVKPLDLAGHGGGAVFTTSDPEYTTFLNWFK